MPISTLLIGLGNIGMGYDLAKQSSNSQLSHAGTISNSEIFELSGGVDIDVAKQQELQKRFNSEGFSTIEEALGVVSPVVAIISTPKDLRLNLVKKLIDSKNLRVIIIEKPLANSIKEAREIIQVCDEHGVALFVNYMRNSSAGVSKFKSWLDKQNLSDPFCGDIWYEGGLLNNGSHFINLLEYLLGPAEKLDSFHSENNGSKNEENIFGILKFANGAVSLTPINSGGAKANGFRIFFKNFSFEFSREVGGFSVRNLIRDELYNNNSIFDTNQVLFPVNHADLQSDFFEQIAKFLDGKNYVACSGDQAFKTLSLIFNKKVYSLSSER